MYNQLSWDDMCLVHAIADAGTLSGAARKLHVSHPTAFRVFSTPSASAWCMVHP